MPPGGPAFDVVIQASASSTWNKTKRTAKLTAVLFTCSVHAVGAAETAGVSKETT